MPKILVNVKQNKKTGAWSVLPYENGVFADMKVAVMDMNMDCDDIIVVPVNRVNHVFDREDFLSKNQLFTFRITGDLVEVVDANEKGPNIMSTYLPIDTDVSTLRYIQGQLVMVDFDK